MRDISFLYLFSIVFFLFTICSVSADQGNDTDGHISTISDLITFVDSSVDFAEKYGKEKAFAEFNDRNGTFIQGDLYIYVYDMNGTVLAHPVNPELIGKNRLDELDAIGTFFIQNLMNAAINNTGFARYTYINPVHNNSIEEKLGYVRMVDDEYWLGSGIYRGPVESGSPSALSVFINSTTDLIDDMHHAKEFAIQTGKEQALTEFANPNEEMFNSKNRYIAAYDLNGTNLAHSYDPKEPGESLPLTSNINEIQPVEKMVQIANIRGSGFVGYFQEEPESGIIRPKLSYVNRIDDWFITSGIYL
jgi:polar amino acid transport system substrate-binding protein